MAEQQAVAYRYERRAFSAQGDVFVPELADNGQSADGCHCRTVADLQRQTLVRFVEYRMAVHGHRLCRQVVGLHENKDLFADESAVFHI